MGRPERGVASARRMTPCFIRRPTWINVATVEWFVREIFPAVHPTDPGQLAYAIAQKAACSARMPYRPPSTTLPPTGRDAQNAKFRGRGGGTVGREPDLQLFVGEDSQLGGQIGQRPGGGRRHPAVEFFDVPRGEH